MQDFTADGVEIKPDLRVFTNNCRWGTVVEPYPCYGDGWWKVVEDGYGPVGLNGERIASRDYITGSSDPQQS